MKKIYKNVVLDIILLKQEDVLIGSNTGFGVDDEFFDEKSDKFGS